jgi:hypothetical protein
MHPAEQSIEGAATELRAEVRPDSTHFTPLNSPLSPKLTPTAVALPASTLSSANTPSYAFFSTSHGGLLGEEVADRA